MLSAIQRRLEMIWLYTPPHKTRSGQNYIYTVCIRYFWQGNHQIYGHIRCIYTVLANPTHKTQVGMETFRLCRELVDGIILVDNSAISAAIKVNHFGGQLCNLGCQ